MMLSLPVCRHISTTDNCVLAYNYGDFVAKINEIIKYRRYTGFETPFTLPL